MLTILTNLIRYNPLVYSYEIFRIATFINNLIQTSTFFNINWNFPLPSLSTSFKVINPFRVKEIMQRLNLVVDSIALLHYIRFHATYFTILTLFFFLKLFIVYTHGFIVFEVDTYSDT